MDWSHWLRILWTQRCQWHSPVTQFRAQDKSVHSHWEGSQRHMLWLCWYNQNLQHCKCTSSLMIYITFIVFFDNQAENADSSHSWHELILFYKVKLIFNFFLLFACIFNQYQCLTFRYRKNTPCTMRPLPLLIYTLLVQLPLIMGTNVWKQWRCGTLNSVFPVRGNVEVSTT